METEPMLQPFGSDLWLVDGPIVTAKAGFHFPTRMAVIRLSDGLMLWSPVQPVPGLIDAVLALGPVRHLVAPNKLHNLYLAPWQAACPDALLHAAPGLQTRRPDLKTDAVLTGTAHPDWVGQVDQVILQNRIADEVVFFHHRSATVLFTDLLQAMPPGWFKGWRALVARADLMTGTTPAVPRKFRLASTNRAALRQGLRTILDWPVRQIVMAHGTPVTSDAQAVLSNAFAWAGLQPTEPAAISKA
jgi:Domain of unknown function (DUF4336)